MIDPLMSAIDITRAINEAQEPKPVYVADDYELQERDILITGSPHEIEARLDQVKAMFRTGKIRNADLSNVKVKVTR